MGSFLDCPLKFPAQFPRLVGWHQRNSCTLEYLVNLTIWLSPGELPSSANWDIEHEGCLVNNIMAKPCREFLNRESVAFKMQVHARNSTPIATSQSGDPFWAQILPRKVHADKGFGRHADPEWHRPELWLPGISILRTGVAAAIRALKKTMGGPEEAEMDDDKLDAESAESAN